MIRPVQSGVTIETIREARAGLGAAVRLTPVVPSGLLSRIAGVPIVLKCEQLQRTGSFKVRGALNFLRLLPPEELARGLITASAGNHAQGVALAGRERGAHVTVVMPVFAPLAKSNAARGYGAEVVLHGASLEEARGEAQAIATREGLIYVPPFDSDAVISGQGTIALEILEQVPDVEEILVPAGGGGLLAGVAVAVKATRPGVRVIGVQSSAMDGILRSHASGRVTTAPVERTVADGVAVAGPSERTFAIIERNVDGLIAAPEEAIFHALVLLLERAKMVVEGAGALGVAALNAGLHRPRGKTVVILSGGNIDINLISSVVRRGLVDAGRYATVALEVADSPGELATVTGAIADARANVLEVEHDRESADLPIGVTVVKLLLEVDGPAHLERVIATLRERGRYHVTHER